MFSTVVQYTGGADVPAIYYEPMTQQNQPSYAQSYPTRPCYFTPRTSRTYQCIATVRSRSGASGGPEHPDLLCTPTPVPHPYAIQLILDTVRVRYCTVQEATAVLVRVPYCTVRVIKRPRHISRRPASAAGRAVPISEGSHMTGRKMIGRYRLGCRSGHMVGLGSFFGGPYMASGLT